MVLLVLLAALMTPPSSIPPPAVHGYARVDGVKLYYAEWGTGAPVILVEGGEDNTQQWGYLVPVLAQHYRVIAFDTRCQGRSACSHQPISYELFARDLNGLMDYLHVARAPIVGWSDGAIVALEMAIHYPTRASRIFVYGANTSPAAMKPQDPKYPAPTGTIALAWDQTLYEKQSPTPSYWPTLDKRINDMWNTQPHITAAELRSIRCKAWIADGDHEEFIKRSDTDFMAGAIPNADELIFPHVGHYAPWQEPALFNAAVLQFLS
jgi:pimeloyl-ACP methyl ester carboxylesterase